MTIKINYSFANFSIKFKLLLSYLALIVIPLGLLLFFNILNTSKETQKQAIFSLEQTLEQSKSYIEFKVEFIRNSLNYIALNDTVVELITRNPAEYHGNIGLWAIDAQNLNRIISIAQMIPPNSLSTPEQLYNNSYKNYFTIHLYMKYGLAAIFQNDSFVNLNDFTQALWYRKVLSNKDIVTWFPARYFSSEGFIYAVRNITDQQDIYKSIGAIRVDIPQATFYSILKQAKYTVSTSVLLINADNEVICDSSSNKYPVNEILFANNNYIKRTGPQKLQIAVFNHQKYLIGSREIDNTDWKMYIVTPYSELMLLNNRYRDQMIFAFVVIAILTVPVAFLVSASATKRLARLVSQMKKVEKGELTPIESIGPRDEIGLLTVNFNNMLTQISSLLDEKYRYGKEIKNLELKALQAQINPHFLYNTLDLINWMAIESKAPQIGHVIKALSKFYKLSLSKGEDYVSIRNELEQVQAYIEIQNFRFNNSIHLSIEMPEEILDYMIIKLILQPIVENSIIHGILEKEDEAGTVRISGESEGNLIRLHVADDGVGMSMDEISRILTDKSCHGYGIMNINDRIKLNFGGEYGLSYWSEPGRGTVATITIPAIRRGEAT